MSVECQMSNVECRNVLSLFIVTLFCHYYPVTIILSLSYYLVIVIHYPLILLISSYLVIVFHCYSLSLSSYLVTIILSYLVIVINCLCHSLLSYLTLSYLVIIILSCHYRLVIVILLFCHYCLVIVILYSLFCLVSCYCLPLLLLLLWLL